MKEEKKCLNCGAAISGNFCSHCGQTNNLPRLTFRGIVSEFFSSAFNIDGPFYKTVIDLFKAPARMFDAYLNGQRRTFYSPVKYLLLCLLIFIFIEYLSGYDPVEISAQVRGKPSTYSNQGMQTSQFILQYINYFSLLLPFTIAIISKLFFWSYRYNLAERTALGFFMSGQYILINLIPLGLSFINPMLIESRYILIIIYFAFVFYSVFLKSSKIKTFFKSVLASILSIILYFAMTYYVALLILRFIQPDI